MMKKLWFLVALWLLFLGNTTFAQTYIQVFSDDFNRADGSVGNSWEELTALNAENRDWSIVDNAAGAVAGGRWSKVLLRPSGEAIKDGKIEFIIPASLDLTKPLAFGAFARVITDAAGTSSYAMYYYPSSHQVVIGYKVNASAITSIQQHTLLANVGGIPAPAAGDKRVEFIVESANPSTTNLTVNVFDSNGLLFTQTVTDSNTKLQAAGRWGLQSFSNISSTEVAAFDTVTIYSADLPANVDLSLTANKSTVKFSDNVIYTLSDDEDETVILSDNGAGGTFFPSATVILNSGNSYTATVNYTPAKAGTIVISGNPANFTGDLESEIFVSPYSTTIGFIGDSITDGNRCSSNNYPSTIAVGDLGLGFTDIKRGVSGASTQKYLENNLASSITAFTNGGVDVVHIMLGTNDAFINVSYNISTTDYKINMQAIIDALKLAGIRQVVLSYPTYSSVSRDVALLTGYQDKINELVVENGWYVLLGDTVAYSYFYTNIATDMCDNLHPNATGNTQLGKFRANAIKSALEYQINPDHHFLSGNTHTLQTTGNLTFRVDKYFGEFSNVVKVDTTQLTTGYTATSGSTNIILEADYLNTLSTGSHTLTVGFDGGVRVSDTFTILPAPWENNTGGNNGNNNGGSSSWWGGWSSASKDNCPNGDFSSSYYDGTCGVSHSEQGEAEVKNPENSQQPVDSSLQPSVSTQNDLTDEILTAYQRAYAHDITTLAPLEAATPDWTVIRGHLAKMVTNYALNALWRTLPEKVPAQCHRKDGSNAWESAEIKDYAVKACSLGLMGMDMDYFQPLLVVTRAQFGTILSRLLRQNAYAGGKPYYTRHLEALKENWIMTQIDNPESRVELRQRVRLMLMRSAK